LGPRRRLRTRRNRAGPKTRTATAARGIQAGCRATALATRRADQQIKS
jgi:hypothetical protein